ncbi:TRAP transporter large permease [Celeribacter indicus]|uniref:TRAP transporter large permease protein n=1 Tax=Celeribacter indicus TaxID=1208324 RepID=A0A0B5E0L8_9RHOB|nr:TRAP transporter large permease [Celeribacter indicus]AJE49183.1 TRAP-T family protein transporter, DctM (12 TMs) subunit [Celeribacter indicus]SDX18310.1 TRAP transporter, DctM subunit [Celeribacter indicus]
MTPAEIGYAGIAVLLMLILLRIPIGLSLILVSFSGLWILVGESAAWGSLGLIPYTFAASWQLSSVPMFVLMGFVCFHAGLTKGLFDAARLWLARLPGGLAIAGVFGATGFAAVTGSSLACAAAMGRIAIPEMMKSRYDAALATGSIAAAGTIGALIPPSILLILYGIIAQVPVGALFLGGVGVGVLTMVAYVAVIMVRVMLNPDLAPRSDSDASWSERLRALAEIWPVLLLIIGVFGGLFSGMFTPTEAGAVGASLSVLIALIKRTLTWKRMWDSLYETLMVSGSIFIIAIGANMLTRFIAFSGSGDALAAMVSDLGANRYVLLLAITIVYLLLGMFLDPIGAMLLTLPILLPILKDTGYDLLWFGVLLAKYLEIGMITPPIGLNVFVLKGVVGNSASLSTIFRGILWFLLADLFIVLAVIVFPEIVTYLPSLLK